MHSQMFVQGATTIIVPISIQASGTAAANRKSLWRLIRDANVLTTVQIGNIIGGTITSRVQASGAPPSAAPVARPDFSFGYVATPETSAGVTNGIADASLIDYCGPGEELDLKGVDALRTCFALAIANVAIAGVARVYLRETAT